MSKLDRQFTATMLPLKAATRKAIGKDVGDVVTVRLVERLDG